VAIKHTFLLRLLSSRFCLSASDYKHIVRIAGKDIAGSKKLITALSEIRGVGYNYSQVLLQSLNINPNIRVGFITDRELTEVEAAIRNPVKSGIPEWYVNRRKDIDTGSHQHLITSDLDFAISNDIDREKNVMSWRGYRHMFGLRVRGQCTRTTGRRGGAVGVRKTGKPMPAGGAPSTLSTGVTAPAPSTESALPKSPTGAAKEEPKK
jgi:small subunit ribosomal protein S13